MTALNPSSTIPLKFGNTLDYVLFAIPLFIVFLMQHAAIKQNKMAGFFLLFTTQLFVMTFFVILFASFYHRDFYTYEAQVILLSFILILLKLDDILNIKNRKPVYTFLSKAVLAIFIMWTAWLMMMFYAIVTREEPRWIESIIYNFVNGIIGLLLLFNTGIMWHKACKGLYFKNGSLYLDNINFFENLSVQECEMIRAFLSAENKNLKCMDFSIHSGDDSHEELCRNCMEKDWTCTSCSYYKNYKNRIGKIKKYLELMQIGTIVPISDNPRKIKGAGWQLRLFDDIRYYPPGKGKTKSRKM